MVWDLKRSLEAGVLKSKVVLACISQSYEKSRNTMFELTEVSKLVDKPIVTLSTDAIVKTFYLHINTSPRTTRLGPNRISN